jgi:Amt family ammonium transporter
MPPFELWPVPFFLDPNNLAVDAVVTFVVAKLLDMSIGLRVTGMEEEVGLDISGHGERAYS